MIERTDLLAFNFYKKEKFTGSFRGMRYRICKADRQEGQTDSADPVFLVTVWPGPYNYASTDPSLYQEQTFPFEESSLDAITDYLNRTYEAGKDEWPVRISV